MEPHHNGKRNGYSYASKTVKKNIEKNEYFKDIRKKLMKEKLKKRENEFLRKNEELVDFMLKYEW